jgi:hypothetical protein
MYMMHVFTFQIHAIVPKVLYQRDQQVRTVFVALLTTLYLDFGMSVQSLP